MMSEFNSKSTQDQHGNCELEPCPFCGGTKLKIDRKSVKVGYTGTHQRIERWTYSVRCGSCHSRGGTAGGDTVPYYKLSTGVLPEWATTGEVLEQKAVDLWNTRTPQKEG